MQGCPCCHKGRPDAACSLPPHLPLLRYNPTPPTWLEVSATEAMSPLPATFVRARRSQLPAVARYWSTCTLMGPGGLQFTCACGMGRRWDGGGREAARRWWRKRLNDSLAAARIHRVRQDAPPPILRNRPAPFPPAPTHPPEAPRNLSHPAASTQLGKGIWCQVDSAGAAAVAVVHDQQQQRLRGRAAAGGSLGALHL